ncbi:glycosyltransferase family 4 protein [Methanothermobacter thermautotrophicus]|jgi:glycosyltransferase involved in cell wall biosynthesis|uniref:Glycosyltransferase family 4 protein n=1 Tax=Methanothermobacter thermautotrophicus TaxID=145262 RepID=A0A7J4MUQ3_METTF|nr:glycosyltransferase family 4 protein [Methanothermobacter thermautotrophicus]WBF08431.1 glycosyltransferase family 4 protein [Methanothermobacter thermautotrophicus]HIH64458.1 glycosyltransferase family 4 protein [Methanothermobacter thermautotrophicus]
MKITYITNLYPPSIIGGAEIVVEKITKKLAKEHEIIVITNNSKNEEKIENKIKFYKIKTNIYPVKNQLTESTILKPLWHAIDLFNINAYKEIKKILKKENPDIIHIHNYKGLSPLAFKAAKDLKIPLVFTAHDYSSICIRANLLNGKGEICENPRIPCKIYNKIQKFLIQDKPDIVTAPSGFVMKQLENAGLFSDARKIVLPNPVETETQPVEKSYDTLDILFVGSLSRHKGPDILIRAFRELENDNLKLHILGKGPDEDELRKLAEGDDRIIFHGFLSGDELMGMYQRANVTVVPSICYDNSPIVIYESLMNSTPVIASRIGGIPELVRDGYNGFLFEPGSVVELSRILKKISEDPSILKGLERNAYESSQKYSIEDHVKRLEEIYRGLL